MNAYTLYDITNQQFISRADGTIIENDLELLINLYLVLLGGRLAYLFEPGKYSTTDDVNTVMETISQKYPEFRKTDEGNKFRYFYHINDLPTQSSGESHDDWVGKILGFDCPGDIRHNTKISYSVNYNINNIVNLYTEICVHVNKEKINDKLKLWNNIVETLGNYKIHVNITKNFPDAMYIEAFLNKDVDFLEKHQFSDWLIGYGHTSIGNRITDLSKLTKLYPYILVYVLMIKFDPLKENYPLSSDMDSKLEQLDDKILNIAIGRKMTSCQFLDLLLTKISKLGLKLNNTSLELIVQSL